MLPKGDRRPVIVASDEIAELMAMLEAKSKDLDSLTSSVLGNIFQFFKDPKWAMDKKIADMTAVSDSWRSENCQSAITFDLPHAVLSKTDYKTTDKVLPKSDDPILKTNSTPDLPWRSENCRSAITFDLLQTAMPTMAMPHFRRILLLIPGI